MRIESFRDLIVWQKSMDLVADIYNLCLKLPRDELYGLQSQLKRSSVSIPSNIAEGKMRSTRKEFANFLTNALGSSAELETQLLLTKKLFNSDIEMQVVQVIEIQRMLSVLIKKLKPRT